MSRLEVLFRGTSLALDDSLLLGAGGEARVFRHLSLDLALKVFHPADPQLPDAARASLERTARVREAKLERLTHLAAQLPELVVAPRELLRDVHDPTRIVGYAMARVPGARDVSVLATRKGRALLTAAQICAVFDAVRAALDRLHALDVVAGDLNDGNVVLDEQLRPRIIDADSMQTGALPCPVAHERFLDPRLYGRALDDRACFAPANDHYALRVLLFQSLLCVHPYGGVHGKLPTLLRRAEARHSVLRSDVTLPRTALPLHTLPDDMLEDFTRCFDGDVRAPLDPRLLQARFKACSCGVEHARAVCPACKTVVQAPAVRTSGGVSEDVVHETRGLFLLARATGGVLRWLVEEDGVIRREDRSTVLVGPRAPGMRFELAGDTTWIAHEGALVAVRGERVVDQAHTAVAHGTSSFAAGQGGLWILEGDTLVHHDTRVRAGRVFEGQTCLVSSDAGGMGLYHAGRMLLGFMFRRGMFFDAELVQRRGKLVDLDVAFDASDERALVGQAFDEDGRRIHALTLLDGRGRRLAYAEGTPESMPCLESIRGKTLANGRILSAASEGIVAIDVDVKMGRLHTGAIFSDTRPFVDATVELLPATGGALFVVAPKAITRLRLKGSRS